MRTLSSQLQKLKFEADKDVVELVYKAALYGTDSLGEDNIVTLVDTGLVYTNDGCGTCELSYPTSVLTISFTSIQQTNVPRV